MVFKRLPGAKSAFSRANLKMITKRHFACLHALTLKEAPGAVVSPQGAPEKPDAPELVHIVIKEHDVGAGTGSPEIDPRLFP